MEIDFVVIKPARSHLYGATSGQEDLAIIKSRLSTLSGTDPLVIAFDFSSAESISGSYIRATILWCLLCGKAHAEGVTPPTSSSDSWAIRPLPIFPIISAANSEIQDEIDDLCKQRNVACLLTHNLDAGARILGFIDAFLFDTLKLVASNGPIDAYGLRDLSSSKISSGGWSNRLAALHAMRLVTRVRAGKSWLYKALTKEYKTWA